MPCPFLQQNMDNLTNDDDSIIDGLLTTTTTTTNEVKTHHEDAGEPLNYIKYVGVNSLLSSLRCLSHTDRADTNSPPVHGEHFFILIHQAFELWFKQIIFNIDSIRQIFHESQDITRSVFDINLRLTQIGKIWNMSIDQLQLLGTMTPMEFLEFREYITPASGFQSLQFRIIEMKLGLTDKSRNSYKSSYFLKSMFKGKQSAELQQSINEKSLLYYLERWLEKIYDNTTFQLNNTTVKFDEVFAESVDSMIDHEKEEKIQNGVDIETAEREAENAKRQFEPMINADYYQTLLDSNERRISQKAMLAALMIAHYYQEPCFQQLYQMFSLLINMDSLMASWRNKHVLLVLHQIGRKPGTGGTGGFSYLQETLSNKFQIFIDLFNISSYLVPRRFLPDFVDNSTASPTPRSLHHVQFPRQVAVVIKQNPKQQQQQQCNAKSVFTEVSNDYYQPLFFLLLFMAGCIFSMLVSRLF